MKQEEIKNIVFSFLILVGLTTGCSRSAENKDNGKLIFHSIDYRYMGRDFKLNRSMTMTTLRHYHLKSQLEAELRSEDKNAMVTDINGNYQYKVLIAPYDAGENNSQDSFLSYDEGVTRIKNGILDTDVTFPIDMVEHPIMMAKVKLMIELNPLDGGPSVSTKWCPFEALTEAGKVDLIDDSKTISDIITLVINESPPTASLTMFNSAEKLSNPPHFDSNTLLQKRTHFIEASDHDLAQVSISGDEAHKNLVALSLKNNVAKDFGKKFCDLFYLKSELNKVSWFKKLLGSGVEDSLNSSCMNDPQKYLNFSVVEYVLSIDSDPVSKPVSSKYFVISDGSYEETSEGHYKADHGYRETLFGYNDSEVGVDLGFLKNNTGVRVGKEWFRFDQDFKAENTAKRSGVVWSRNFQVDDLEFEFSAMVKECFLISSKAPRKDQHPYQYCFEKPKFKPVVSEAWYFLYQISLTPLMNTALDRASASQLLFSAMIRGSYNFNGFIENLSARLKGDPLGDHFFKSLNIKNDSNSSSKRILTSVYTDGNIPGIIFE
jgi:hypothetical protein